MTRHPAIGLALAGGISPAVALARLVLDGMTPAEIEAMLPRQSALAELFATQRDNLVRLAATVGAVDHRAGGDTVAAIAAMFDRAVAVSPEASVAAYSLGDPDLLAVATAEVVDWLQREGLATPGSDVLDFGCGIGRLAGALAPHVRSVIGLDVSAGMIAEAARRHSAANLRFAKSDGECAIDRPAGSLDLVLAVDSLPYLVQTGIARSQVGEMRRVLRPGGHLVVLNLSYRGDEADAADAQSWAADLGYDLRARGARPFKLWDGAAYVFAVEG